MDQERLRRIARRHFGVFTRAHARECGFSAKQVRRRLASGEWQAVVGTSYALGGVRITRMIYDRAAQLSLSGSVLAAASAARVWGIHVPDDRTFLYVGAHGRSRLPGVVGLHTDPTPRDVRLSNGLPTTMPACAVVESLRLLPEPAAIDLLDRSLQRGWLTIDELVDRVARAKGPGRAQLVRLVRVAVGGERSAAERRFTDLLKRAGFSGWAANVEIHDDRGLVGVADVAFRKARLVVEIDGWAFHTTPDRFQRDRVRQNRLVSAGWTVLRFTWRDLTERPRWVLRTVHQVLDPSRPTDHAR
jgi:very-short-patch-repair endonuclease